MIKDKAATRILVGLRQGLGKLRECYSVAAHALGIGENLILLDPAAHHGHLRNSSNGQQPRPDHPIGEAPHLHRIHRITGETK